MKLSCWSGRLSTIAAVALAFAYGVSLRRAFFGMAPGNPDPLFRINTFYALNAVRNWMLWGPRALGFQTYLLPVADPLYPPMPPYQSYPPLYVGLPWLVAKLTGIAPTQKLLQSMSLAANFALAVAFCGWARTLALRARLGALWTWALSTLAGILSLLLPGYIAWFGLQWWPDLVTLPFCALLALAELKAPLWRHKSWFRAAFFLLIALTALSDWLGVLFVAAILGKRLLDKDRKKIHFLEVLVPLAISLCAFGTLVVRGGRGLVVGEKFVERFGAGARLSDWLFQTDLLRAFGVFGLPLVVAGFFVIFPLAWLFRRGKEPGLRELAGAALVLVVPLYAHLALLHEHYYVHTYEWAKFGFALIAVPFLLPPLLLVPRITSRLHHALFASLYAAVVIVFVAGFPAVYAGTLAGGSAHLPEETVRRCEALLPENARGTRFISPNFATIDFFLHAPRPPAPSPTLGAICFPAVEFTPDPVEASRWARTFPWAGQNRKEHPRVIAVFDGEPPAPWRPLLLPGTQRSVGGLELFDADTTRLGGHCYALEEKLREGDILVSPQFAKVNHFPADPDGDRVLRSTDLCLPKILYTGDPDEAAILIELYRWDGNLRSGRSRLILVTSGEPTAAWKPKLKKNSLEHAGDLELRELEPEAMIPKVRNH